MTKLAVLVSSEDVLKRVDTDQAARQVMALAGQDSLSRVTRVVSDYSAEWATQAVGRDPFTDDTSTGYGGMKFMAGLEGSWKAEDGIMTLVSSMHRSIAEYVPIIDTLNGSAQMAFMLNDAGKKEYGGIAFRVLDKDNYFFVFYDVQSDKIQLCRNVSGGTDIVYATSATMSWTAIGTWRWLRVELRYANCTVLTSSDGITWNVLSWASGSGELPGMSVIQDNAKYLDWSGKFGVIGKGYSDIDAPPPIEIIPWPDPTPVPTPGGGGSDAGGVVAATATAIHWSNDFNFSGASQPTFSTVKAMPSGFSLLERSCFTLSGKMVYMIATVSGVRGLWCCSNPRDDAPTWTNLYAVGDAFHGYTIHSSSFQSLVPHGETVTTGIVYYHDNYIMVVCEFTGAAHVELGPFYNVDYGRGVSYRSYHTRNDSYPYVSTSGATIGYYDSIDGRSSAAWCNLIGGNYYGVRSFYSGGDLSVNAGLLRINTQDRMYIPATGGAAVTFGLYGEHYPRGAWKGKEIDFVDGDGHFWQASDGATLVKKTTTPWAMGVVEQAKLAGGGALVWLAKGVEQSNEFIRLSTDGGVTWKAMTGNFWDLVSGDQTFINMQLVFP